VTNFQLFIGIDYSGAQTPTSRLPGLQVFAARGSDAPCEKWFSPAASNNGKPCNWTRAEIARTLLEQTRQGVRFLAGIDHGFSFPYAYFKRYGLRTWDEFLQDFVHYWPTHGDHVYVDFVRHGVLHKQDGGPAPGERTGQSTEFRLTERWTSSAKSVFQFDMQGSVAKSTHAGIPWLKWLRDEARDRIHFWPFDGWTPAADKAVIAEVYPSIFRNRYGRAERSKDEHDAFAAARWMADMADRGALPEYFAPPLTDLERGTAEREGWILGVR
jgi:hypothetical protein